MTQIDIQLNLEKEVEIFQTAYGIDVVYPNMSYPNDDSTPVNGEDYIRISYINGDTFQREMGDAAQNRSFVIMQLDIFTSAGTGKATTKAIIDSLESYFYRGNVINNNGLNTRIIKFVSYTNNETTVNFNPFVQITTRTDYPN